jgi:hypothetical protein
MNNMVFKNLITWQKMEDVILEFKEWCELSSVQGAIDDTHISISRPKVDLLKTITFIKQKDIPLLYKLLILEGGSLTYMLVYLEV